jgi:DNA polymerase
MTAQRYVPADADIATLASAAEACRGCELYQAATQVVFGSGPGSAGLVLVGEQPGDVEDRRGKVFVGPAGRMLDRALEEAGIDRQQTYLTNAVKHFRFKSTESSKRRIHQRPSAGQITACRPWLTAELTDLSPHVVVALGAVAAQSLFGRSFRVTKQHGELISWPPETGPFAASRIPIRTGVATIHPSAVLRGSSQDRAELYSTLVSDLRIAAGAAGN